ncbi:NAD(+) diphosphatase [Phormidesmis priestleyi]
MPTFLPGTTPPPKSQPAYWFAFVGNKLLVRLTETVSEIPRLTDLTEIGLKPIRTQFLGTLDGCPCYSAELDKATISSSYPQGVAPVGLTFQGLRELYEILEEDLFSLAGRAVQIMEWDRTHQYCGHCATPMIQIVGDRAKRCPSCGLVNYPRLSPAIIVLISRGQEVLLARAPRFRKSMYSVLAGFVEPGESLEETVIREVREEVGIEIKDIRYFGSQPWAFPNSLMIGFTATYASGEIVIDPKEIAEAAWFHKHNLPEIPSKISIARKLIDHWREE